MRSVCGDEDMTARTMWPSLLEILNDGLSNFELDWTMLDSASLGTSHAECLATPVEIVQL